MFSYELISVSCSEVNLHFLGRDAKLLLKTLPTFFLNLRLDYCRRADPRNIPAFVRQKFNSMLLVLFVMRDFYWLLQQTTVKTQDKAFRIITHWPHHSITSSTELTHANSNLLAKILRMNFTPELITDSSNSFIYSCPFKNDLARASGIILWGHARCRQRRTAAVALLQCVACIPTIWKIQLYCWMMMESC